MGLHTEDVLEFAPGIIFECLDDGGMITDRNSGDYVPADQILIDPLHFKKTNHEEEGDFYALRSYLSIKKSLKMLSIQEAGQQDQTVATQSFANEDEELAYLIEQQQKDMARS